MSYTKQIVCLANSWKKGGSCFAGKEVGFNGTGYGDWIRPISVRETQEISFDEQALAGNTRPQLLDVIEVPLRKHAPTNHQVENHLIADGDWKKAGRLAFDALPKLLDTPKQLWVNKPSTTNLGKYDQMTPSDTVKMTNSLLLIKPDSFSVVIHPPHPNTSHNKIRSEFDYNGVTYNFKVTDPAIKSEYDRQLAQDEKPFRQTFSPKRFFLCISLAETAFLGYHYKLVAAVFHDD